MPFDPPAVAEFCRRKIEAAELRVDPFPQISVPGLFPDDFYGAFIGALPTFSAFNDVGNYTGNLSSARLRECCSHTPKLIETFDAAQRAVAAALLDRFAPHFVQYARSLWPAAPADYVTRGTTFMDSQFGVVERLPGFCQGAHLDGVFRILSVYVYLAQRGPVARAGTSVYRVTKIGDGHRPLSNMFSRTTDNVEVELAAVNDYDPNTLFAFLNSARSYHGVERFTAEQLAGNRRLSLNMYVNLHTFPVEYLIGQGLRDFGIQLTHPLRE